MDDLSLFVKPISNNIEQLNVISQNVANINTPGYSSKALFIKSLENGDKALTEVINSKGHTVRNSGDKFDIAVNGDGFFLIEKAQGLSNKLFISKNGHFYLDQEQKIRHASGGYLLGDNGHIQLSGHQLKVNAQSEVLEQGSAIAQIKLVKPSHNAELISSGDSLYQLKTGELVDAQASLKQGFINNSNVSASHEMTRLIQLSRHTESLQKAASVYNEILSKGVKDIGG